MEPMVELNSSNGKREIMLRTAHFSKRRIFITGVIDDNLADSVIMQLMWLTGETNDPINIFINSPGGDVDSGLAIYDVVQSIASPVYVCCTGMAASMAALILAGGQPGRRYILPHSKVMIHEPYMIGGVGGSAGNIQNTATELLKTQQVINKILSRHTGQPLDEIEKATDHDNIFTADESVDFGLCDAIVPGPLWQAVPEENIDDIWNADEWDHAE